MTIVFLIIPIALADVGEKAEHCPMHSAHAQAASSKPSDHFAGVDERGDHVMGFDHQVTAHHFTLTRRGGIISAESRDASDQNSRDAIRTHLQHIAQAFAAGDFEMPMLIHDKVPPGVSEMKQFRASIQYRFELTERGGRVVIITQNRRALDGIHRFLRFQIEDIGPETHQASRTDDAFCFGPEFSVGNDWAEEAIRARLDEVREGASIPKSSNAACAADAVRRADDCRRLPAFLLWSCVDHLNGALDAVRPRLGFFWLP